MTPIVLIIGVLLQIHGNQGQNIGVLTADPYEKQFCEYDAFISSAPFGDKVYLVPFVTADRQGDWYQARGYCAKHCAELVTIQSDTENSFFLNFTRSVGSTQAVWLGGEIAQNAQNFTWSNGEPVNYTNKASGEYNEVFSYGITCLNAAYDVSDNFWYNYYCSYTGYFIACQRPSDWSVCE